MNVRALVFDTGPIISLTINNLLWLLEPLKERFRGAFYITPHVYEELIDRPLETKRYKFEALQVLPIISRGIIDTISEPEMKQKTEYLLNLMNTCFYIDTIALTLVHFAEIETLACALITGAETVVIDERTARKFIEDPFSLQKTLEKKLQKKITMNTPCLQKVQQELKGLQVIRSFDLIMIAYELGLLDRYILDEEKNVIKNLDKAVLEGALWGVKLNGCSARDDEIEQAVRLLKRR
ncbi:hypothetical protein HYY69_07740 [Candidatus Woesearchaeota archaeon]|nr:hypothetical protein [Candidatus Woesearchaeota archaeon]